MIQFTPTEQRLLEVFSDGRFHHREELYPCIADELSNLPRCLNNHIVRLRHKIGTIGQDILCVARHRKIGYQQVRLLASSVDGLT